MEQMNHGHLLTVERGNLALVVGDLDALVNTEHEDTATLAEEDFCFGWVSCVCLVVHCQACDSHVILAGKDKECWCLVVFDPVRHCESQCHHEIL